MKLAHYQGDVRVMLKKIVPPKIGEKIDFDKAHVTLDKAFSK